MGCRAFGDGDGFVVSGDRDVAHGVQQHLLVADRAEHRWLADAGALGDLLDRRRAVAAGDEQVLGRVEHGSPGGLGLALAQR